MRKLFLFSIPILISVYLANLHSCKKEEVGPFNLISVSVNGRDLTNATNIAANYPIVVTFSSPVNASTVGPSTISLTRDYDQLPISLNFIVSGNTITATPVAGSISGAYYSFEVDSAVRSKTNTSFGSYKTQYLTSGRFVPEGQIAYWTFNNTTEDAVGTYDASVTDIVDLTYTKARNDSAQMAASFNGTTSLVQVAKGSDFLKTQLTLSFWMYLNSVDHTNGSGQPKGSYVIGIGNIHGLQFEVDAAYQWVRFSQALLLADNSTRTNDFKFFANGITNQNVQNSPDSATRVGIENSTVVNSNYGTAGIRQQFDNTWAQVVMTFVDSTKTRTLYINGAKVYQQNLSLLNSTNVAASLRPLSTVTSLTFIADTTVPALYDDKLVFGFWQSREAKYGSDSAIYVNQNANHFKGLLDDVRFFNRALSDTEVSLLYNSEK